MTRRAFGWLTAFVLLLAGCDEDPTTAADESTAASLQPPGAGHSDAADASSMAPAGADAPAPPPASGAGRLPDPPGPGPWFVAAGPETGLNHSNLSGPTSGVGKRYLRDTIGQGIAVLDVDGDGLLDLYFPQGTDGSADGGGSANLLYLNQGDGTWLERGETWNVDDPSYSFGALAFDIDADGDEDLLVTNLGPNRLLRNDGQRFTDVTADHPGLAGTEEWSTGAAAGDVDGDGDLDVYLANYVQQDIAFLDEKGLCMFMGCRVPCGPNGLSPQADRFFLNSGAPDFRLVEASAAAGLADVEVSYGFQPTFVDLDDDGDLDLYVTNDSVYNFLFVNDGAGHFTETALIAGAACGRMGQLEAGMGLATGHPDDDALPELYVTNFSNQSNSYYSNMSTASDEPWFEETSELAGCGRPTWFRLAWGTSFSDFDNDGHLDLFAANGHIYHQVTGCAPERIIYEQQNDLFRGTQGGFVDWAARAGPAFGSAASHRGSVVLDLDGDGDLDLVVNRLDGVPLVARNESREQGHWMAIEVRKRSTPGGPAVHALGARVTVSAGGITQRRDVIAGSSFLCTESPRLHIGLGAATHVERLDVRLPGHATATLERPPIDRLLRVVIEPGGELTLTTEEG